MRFVRALHVCQRRGPEPIPVSVYGRRRSAHHDDRPAIDVNVVIRRGLTWRGIGQTSSGKAALKEPPRAAEDIRVTAPRRALDRRRRRHVLALLCGAWAAVLLLGMANDATAHILRHGLTHPPRRSRHHYVARIGHRLLVQARQRARARPRASTAAGSGAPSVVFGIYPGGAAGATGPNGPVAPEDPARRLAALEQLRAPGAPFVLHIYAGYTGAGGWTAAQQVGDDLAQYTAAGFEVELVLTYRPADGGSPQDVTGFEAFVRQTLASFGPDPRFVSLQVTNEANVSGAPNASDGWFGGARDALIGGVIAAKAAIRANRYAQVQVGFNWAAAGDADEHGFWSYLARRGGAEFVNALDWVGVDIYPGTWGPALPALPGSLASGTQAAIRSTLSELRRVYLPQAGIPISVPLHISESGYPTGPDRTRAMQVEAMRAAVGTVVAARGAYNVTDYRWFDLRDALSSRPDFQSQYGLMTDAYTPKPAFFAYRDLVARYSR
jgi:hypothetical protein